MKKLISLLLALVLCTGLLAGVSLAADRRMPEQCDPDKAIFVVTHEGDPTAEYYFDSLGASLINWACQKLEGHTTITMTKDVELELPGAGAEQVYGIPQQKSDWYNEDPHAKSITFDLGGNTLSYTGGTNMLQIHRYNTVFKNGTIIYDNEGSECSIFRVSKPTSYVATTASAGTKLYTPTLTLENVHIYNNSTAGGSIIENYGLGTTFTIKDSVLWSEGNAILVSKSDQSNHGNYGLYKGPANLTLKIESSVIGTASNVYPVKISEPVDLATDNVMVSIKDSTIVSNVGGDLPIEVKDASVINTDGQQAVVNANWNMSLRNGKSVNGKAYTYGAGSEAGSAVAMPFTDVDENAWYYTHVCNLYNAKIIAGMTETTFVPDGTLTYGQALKLITLAVGVADQAATDTHWASGYLNYALGMGWMYTEVDLDSTITRESFCQIAAAAAGVTEQPASNPFKDTTDGSVLALYNAGIINGMSEDTFSPNSSLTRAQISKIIDLLVKM